MIVTVHETARRLLRLCPNPQDPSPARLHLPSLSGESHTRSQTLLVPHPRIWGHCYSWKWYVTDFPLELHPPKAPENQAPVHQTDPWRSIL